MAGIIARSEAVDPEECTVLCPEFRARRSGAGTFRTAGPEVLAGIRAALWSGERQPVCMIEGVIRWFIQ